MNELHRAKDDIARRMREHEMRRQVLANRIRRATITRVPTLARELLKMTAASMVGYWLIAWLVSYVGGPRTVYTLTAIALLFALKATYYKYKLAVDPDFRLPKCGCGGTDHDDTEAVLTSRHSAVLGIPNSLLAILLYVAMLVTFAMQLRVPAAVLAAVAVAGSLYLSYVMVAVITRLCTTCVNIAALNILILIELVR
jgi:uncharacterized membrane protein